MKEKALALRKNLFILIPLSYYLIQGVIHNLGHVVTPTYVNTLGIPQFMFGFFFASMSLGMLIGAPIWGILGDQRTKKPLILFGLLLYSLGQVLFVLVENLYLMTFARFLSGFGVAAYLTLMLSHVIGVVDLGKRTKYLSLSAALFALGTTFGYQIGGIMGDYFIREVFYVQAILNTVFVIFIALSMKETRQKTAVKKQSFFENLREASRLDRSLLLFLIALTLATISASTLSKYFDVYMIDLGYTPRQLGTFIMITGFIGLFTNFVIVPLLAKLKQDLVIMQVIQILSAIIVLLVFRSNRFITMLYSVFLFYYVLKATFQPFEQNYISLNAKGDNYGTIMGVRHSFFSIGMVLGPLLSGFLYDYSKTLVFDVSAGMFLFSFVLLSLSKRRLKFETSTDEGSGMLTALETADYKASE